MRKAVYSGCLILLAIFQVVAAVSQSLPDTTRSGSDSLYRTGLYNAQKGNIFQPAEAFAAGVSFFLQSRGCPNSFTLAASLKEWQFNYSFIYTDERYSLPANIAVNYIPEWYTHDLSASKSSRSKIGL